MKYIFSKKNKYLFLIFLFYFLHACGEYPAGEAEDHGLIMFNVEWKGVPEDVLRTSNVDCAELGIFTVEAIVYDENNNKLAEDGPHPCDRHSGTFFSLKEGPGRKVVILGKGSSDTIIFRGESLPVTIKKGETANAGSITAEIFKPELYILPIKVLNTAIKFRWKPSKGAVKYHLECSEDIDFNVKIIENITISKTEYIPEYKFSDKKYYLRVKAEDRFGNISGWAGGAFESSSLAAYYPFNGDANNMAINGAVLTPDRNGKENSAYSFDGIDDYISTVDKLPDIDNGITVMAWIKTDESGNKKYIISKYAESGDKGILRGWLFYIDPSGKAGFHGRDGSAIYCRADTLTNVADGNWHLVAGTHIGNIWEIFVDGVLENSTMCGSEDGGSFTNNAVMEIGRYGEEYYSGIIDDIRIYNRALSEEEVNSHYIPYINPPAVVSANPDDKKVRINWSPVPGADLYNIYHSTIPGVTKNNGTKISNETTSYTHTGLTNNVTCYYIITAENSFMESDGSREIDATPVSELIAYWPFNGNANDESGNGHNGTVNGAVLTADSSGNADSAYNFDGIDDYISVNDSSAWAFGVNPFSISFWINFKVTGNFYYFISQNEGGGAQNSWAFLHNTSDLVLSIGKAVPIRYPWQPSSGTWYMLTVTRNGSMYKIYKDGVLLDFASDLTSTPDVNAQLFIGKSEQSGRTFNGSLDEISIYNRALSDAEVKGLYEQKQRIKN